MKRLLIIFGLVIATISLLASSAHAAMQVPPPPANGWYVLDQTKTLTSEEIEKLNEKIDGHRSTANVQFAVLMVPQIEDGEYLERFSLNVARQWGIGEKGKNNGALLLIAKDDRRMRIEVGTGLEGDLTDTRASRIINDRIAPEFRNGRYYAGIESGLQGMVLAVENREDLQLKEDESNGWLGIVGEIGGAILLFGVTGVIWLGAILGRTKRWWPGGILGAVLGAIISALFVGGWLIVLIAIVSMVVGLFFDFSVSKNFQKAKKSGHTPAWWAGGTTLGGGGGFSGGGGGFGGGSFGGGGASGSW